MDKVSIVILNWNRKKDTLDCLESIRNVDSKGIKLELVVVDNASKDGSVEAFKNLSFDNIAYEIVENKKNLGFAEGNNIGVRHSFNHGAEYVVILNNDTIVDKRLITGLVSTARKYPDAGLISPKIYFAKGYEYHPKRYKKKDLGKVIWYAGGDLDWDDVYGTNRGVDEVDHGQYEKVVDTEFATGACMLVKKKAIKKAGMFDWRYFMYLEDADLSQRMKKKKWRVMYTPKAHLWHKVAQSSKIGGDLNDYYITRNRLIFGMKYAPIRTRFALYRESMRILIRGRRWQKFGVLDFYLGIRGKGSYKQ